jgi:hypothetical protein
MDLAANASGVDVLVSCGAFGYVHVPESIDRNDSISPDESVPKNVKQFLAFTGHGTA